MSAALWLSAAARAAVVLAGGLTAAALLRGAAAATRRLVLAVTVVAAAAVPLVALVGPRVAVPAPAVFTAHEVDGGDAMAAPAPRAVTDAPTLAPAAIAPPPADDEHGAATWLLAAWGLGAALLALRAARAHVRAWTLARRAAPLAGAWRDDLRVTDEIDAPIVTGLVHPTILLPTAALAWPPERCALVLAHERAHARRRDVLVQAIGDVACALHWWNPLAWRCARDLRVACEHAADDAVLAEGARPSRYAEELLAIAARAVAPSAALAMAAPGALERRVVAILSDRARAPLAAWRAGALTGAGVALAAAIACAAPQRPTAPATGTARDPEIQRLADAELAVLARDWAPELATIVVLDPATGEILASAGHRAGAPGDDASAVALVPGSTFKPITIAAALESRAITADQTFACGPEPRAYGDRAIHDWTPTGACDLGRLLAVSSNVGTTHIFDALGGEPLARWARQFHFGIVPDHVESGSYAGASLAIGEGGLLATPLEMAAAYAALADDGVYHAPRRDRGASTGERVVSAATARAVSALLETAVTDASATGAAARVPGVRVGGKTGTAEWTAPDGTTRTYASFIGIADLPTRRVVALVGVETGRGDASGGKVAAPAFARLIGALAAR